MKLLLLGGTGQIGWELQRSLAPLGLTAADVRRVELTDPERLRTCLRELAPEVIVNAAGYTDVDRAEAQPDLAHQINAVAPGVMAEAAAATGATLVHYSSDYVFDGSGTQARDEQAAIGPLNVYGRSKAEGERRIRAAGCRHLILRTSWVHGARGSHFISTVLRLAAEHEVLEVVDDQVGAPTGADLLADVTAHALRALQADPALAGTYHCAAAGQVSRFELARFVIEHLHAHGRRCRLAPQGLRPIATSARGDAARRPLNSRLDTRKLATSFDLVLPPWQDGVARLLSAAGP